MKSWLKSPLCHVIIVWLSRSCEHDINNNLNSEKIAKTVWLWLKMQIINNSLDWYSLIFLLWLYYVWFY